MEYAIFEGDEFCSFSLKDLNGHYYEEFRKNMRKKSQENAFTCPECGEHVILNAGPILPPYFSHHKGSNCIAQNNGESKEHREGRYLLYLLGKVSFPKADIRTNYTHDNKKRSHVYINNKDECIALNYITSRLVIREWEEKHDYYRQNGIVDVWILSKNSNLHLDSKNISLNSYLTSRISKTNTIKLLDTINKRITLLHFKQKEAGDQFLLSGSNRIFEQETYNLADLRLQSDGEFFYKYKETNKEFNNLDTVVDGRNLRKVIERNDQKGGKLDLLENSNKVKEYAVLTHDMKNTFLFKTTNMYWELPLLIGTLEEIKLANVKRLDYFIAQDKEIQTIKTFDRKEKRIIELKKYIESKIYAKDWIPNQNPTKRWR